MDVTRYGPLAVAAIVTAGVALLTLDRTRQTRAAIALFATAFVLFVIVDLVSGQAITNRAGTAASAGAILVFLAVVLIDVVVLVRRARDARRTR